MLGKDLAVDGAEPKLILLNDEASCTCCRAAATTDVRPVAAASTVRGIGTASTVRSTRPAFGVRAAGVASTVHAPGTASGVEACPARPTFAHFVAKRAGAVCLAAAQRQDHRPGQGKHRLHWYATSNADAAPGRTHQLPGCSSL